MKDSAPGADGRAWNEARDTVTIELPREAWEAISEMCAYLADLVASSDCGCETCDERVAQAEAWETVFRGMAEAEPGTTHELVTGQGEYVQLRRRGVRAVVRQRTPATSWDLPVGRPRKNA